MRFCLGPHRPRLAFVRIEQAGFLLDGAAVLNDLYLTARFVLDSLTDKSDRIDVLDFAPRVERRPWLAHRDIHVSAQTALLHVAVTGAEVPQDGAKLRHIGLRLVGG